MNVRQPIHFVVVVFFVLFLFFFTDANIYHLALFLTTMDSFAMRYTARMSYSVEFK